MNSPTTPHHAVTVDPLSLLQRVREAAVLANPAKPLSVSQRVFDAAAEAVRSGRERSADHADLPRAKRIAERLGLSWPDVLVVAHAPAAMQNQLLAVKARKPAASWLTEAGVRSALRLAAFRLGSDTLTLAEYRAQRQVLLRADRARWLHGGGLRLPSDEQVIAVAGSWDAALRLAGLQATSERRAERRSDAAPTLIDLLARFHDEYGVQPSARDLRAFARGNGVPYPSARSQRFSAAVGEWRRQRKAEGLPDPIVPTRVGGRGHKAPDYSRDVGAARPNEQRRDKWSRGDCVAAVGLYLADTAGRRTNQRGYADWAVTRPSAPAMSTIQEHGGWEAVRREAMGEQARAS